MTALANIPVTCHACGVHFRTRSGNAGKRGSCPKCGAPVHVMSEAPVEERREAPAPPSSVRPGLLREPGSSIDFDLESISANTLLTGFGVLTALILTGLWLAS